MQNAIFTLGHSTHEIEKFIRLLKVHHITALCDVRSSPYSRFNPQFNRENLKISLRENGIKYVFLGKELGARSDDSACYKNGKVSYDLLANSELFQSGIDRVIKGSKDFKIALVCAEKDPLECHRTILVARELEKKGHCVIHILEDGTIEKNEEAVARLVKGFNSGQGDDLFLTEEEIKNRAFSKQAEKISYTLPEFDVEEDADVQKGMK